MVRLCWLLLLALLLPGAASASTPYREVEQDPSQPTVELEAPAIHSEVSAEQEFAAIPEGPERILSFDSEIDIREDGKIDVTERLSVLVLGRDIKRGIMREIPTIYGKRHKVLVPFEIISVRRNGEDENFTQYALSNGVGLRIGRGDHMLEHDVQEYEIRYRMERQIGRFSDWDELYWNVNGNAWEFQIDQISCTVHVPGPPVAGELRTEAYTGYFGSRGKDYTVSQPADNIVRFESTRQFNYYEGMTIVVGFPKGLVAEPAAQQKFAWWLETNGSWSIGLLLLLLVLGWSISTWRRVGRDPREGLVIHEERPLIGLSAARLRFIWMLHVDRTLMTALIMELAQQGHLRLRRKTETNWIFSATDRTRKGLQPEELAFLTTIFSKGSKSFSLNNKNSSRVQAATRKVEAALVESLHHVHYEMNAHQRASGFLLSIGAIVLYVGLSGYGIFFFSPGDFFLLLLALLSVNLLFYVLLPAYTELGRAVLDRIFGFRLAMSGGEDSFGRYQHADEVLSEKYLPYAVALGVNEFWARRFKQLMEQRGEPISQPDWFSGHPRGFITDDQFDYLRFGNSFPRRLSNAYGHASRPPPPPPGSYSGGSSSGGSTSSGSWGSSSGSGFSSGSSGGSSGGGGGGGGGRGW